jgi:hypothetical protein
MKIENLNEFEFFLLAFGVVCICEGLLYFGKYAFKKLKKEYEDVKHKKTILAARRNFAKRNAHRVVAVNEATQQ